jgi:hypothetical protein
MDVRNASLSQPGEKDPFQIQTVTFNHLDTTQTTQPLSSQDRQVIQELKDKAWFTLLKLYFPLFLALIFVYYKFLLQYPEHPEGFEKMSRRDYTHVYEVFAPVFGAIFLFFLIKDFRRLILPLGRELRSDKKICFSFFARKYEDPIFNKCLIFYPGKEDVYIEMDPDEFQSVQNGQALYLETGTVTGEILLLKSDTRDFKTADEYSFSD